MKGDFLPGINDSTLFQWLVLISSTFTVFAFWGFLSCVLLERAQERGIPISYVYLAILIVSAGILVSTYVAYIYLIKSQQINIPEGKEPRIKLKE